MHPDTLADIVVERDKIVTGMECEEARVLRTRCLLHPAHAGHYVVVLILQYEMEIKPV